MNLLTAWFKRTFADPQVVILGIVLVVSFAIVIGLGRMLAPVFAGIVVAYLLEAVVARLQMLGLSRLISVLLVFLLFLASFFFRQFFQCQTVFQAKFTNGEFHLINTNG